MSGICWGPLWYRVRRRCRFDGAVWNSVGGGSERGEKADGDGKADAEYGASHVEDGIDELQKPNLETEIYNGSESVKDKEVLYIKTVLKTEKIL